MNECLEPRPGTVDAIRPAMKTHTLDIESIKQWTASVFNDDYPGISPVKSICGQALYYVGQVVTLDEEPSCPRCQLLNKDEK